MQRSAKIDRKTSETDIKLQLDIDGSGKCTVATGIGFFDHMLTSFSRHGFFDLDCYVNGDLHVDCHHTIEDVGIVLGQAIKEAVGEKKGIKRYGSFILPMDETLVLCAIDLSGRPYFSYDVSFTMERVGYMDTEMNTALTDPSNPRFQEITNRIPAHRWGTPDDMKGTVIFLASHASDYLNGAVIPVDGGYLVK